MTSRSPSSVTKWRKGRSKRWDAARKAKLNEIAKRNPGLIYDARRLGEIRRDYEPYADREDEIVGELKAEGLSLNEIGATIHMYDQAVVERLRRWRQKTS